MHQTGWRQISSWIHARQLKTRTKPDWKRWAGTQFIAWPWSVAGAAGKPVFSTIRNRVRRRPAITLWQVAGRLTTRFTGDSTRDLTLESSRSKKHQNDDSTLESSRHKLLIVLSESSMTLWRVVGKSYTNRRRLGFTLQKVILRNLITHN